MHMYQYTYILKNWAYPHYFKRKTWATLSVGKKFEAILFPNNNKMKIQQ